MSHEEMLEEQGDLRVRLMQDEAAEAPDWDDPTPAELRAYAEGDVWGYVVERRMYWVGMDDPRRSMTTWEEVDSCWSFYGRDYAEEEARDAFNDARQNASATTY